MEAIYKKIEEKIGKGDGGAGTGNLRSRIFNTHFEDPEVERLRIQYVQLNEFQESWIPRIRAGGFRRFELYDLVADPKQKTDVSARHPDLFARLKKQLLEINASVMADAPVWASAPAASPAKPQPDLPNAESLADIDRSDLPNGYDSRKHQEYVDRRMAGLSEAQRAQVGQLWKKKQRLDRNMPNRGESFVKIMEYVARNVK